MATGESSVPVRRPDHPLQQSHPAEEDQRQRGGQRRVHQRLADDHIDVPQPVAQDGDANRHGDHRHR